MVFSWTGFIHSLMSFTRYHTSQRAGLKRCFFAGHHPSGKKGSDAVFLHFKNKLMKKLSLAVLIAGLSAGTALAQSNVTITGQLDNGFIKENGSDARMWRNHDNLIRFKGSEDLGNGVKAVFNLENRLNPNNGTRCSGNNAVDKLHGTPGVDWQGAANVGFKDSDMGSVLFGRTSSITVSNYSKVDPFGYDGIAASGGAFDITYSGQIANSVRYDSPQWQGFSFSGSYSLGKESHKRNTEENAINYHSYGNDGFAAGLVYENGGLLLLADYERLPDSDKSWSWDAGAAYTYNGLTFSAGYHAVTVKRAAVDVLIDDDNALKQKNAIAAVNYATGPHAFKFSYNWQRAESNGDYDGHSNKYALGYVYSFSKRTSLYGHIVYVDNSNDAVGRLYNSNGTEQDSMTGVQFGITHKF